jgi:4-hydroxy-2-oxoheptanedioate aldolase
MTQTAPNRYVARMRAGEKGIAAFCNIPDLLVAETLSSVGFDLVIVDLQHGAGTLADLQGLLLAIERHGAAAFARVSWNSPGDIMRAVDVGATGVIVPMVETAEQALVAAQAMRYPPLGNRSYGPMRAQRVTADEANARVQCFPMIETALGLANAEEIAAVPGVDGLFVGPFDLGLTINVPIAEIYTHEAIADGLRAVVAAAKKHGKLVGTVARDAEYATWLFELGVDWAAVGNDKAFIAASAQAAIAPWLPR